MLLHMFLQLVSPRAAVLTQFTLERLLRQVNALMSDQVTLLDEPSTTRSADM